MNATREDFSFDVEEGNHEITKELSTRFRVLQALGERYG